MRQSVFYDDIAEYYDLIFADWEVSMQRHGAAIAQMLQIPGSSAQNKAIRILDVAAGIGTQALPLARLGCDVVARDLSPRAIARLRREAVARGVQIDAAQADMRTVADSVEGCFDVVFAFDNAIPHLLSDAEIGAAFQGFADLLKPDGVLLISVRDYDLVERTPTSVHPYGQRTRDERTFRLAQEWRWLDTSHYRTAMIVEELADGAWSGRVRVEADYYAIAIPRLLHLMEEAGLKAGRVEEVDFFQPVLRGYVF